MRENVLKSNKPNSISKDALKNENCLWLINCTTQPNNTWSIWDKTLSLIERERDLGA